VVCATTMLDHPTAIRTRKRLLTTIRDLLQSIFDAPEVNHHLVETTVNRLEPLIPELEARFQLRETAAQRRPDANDAPDKSQDSDKSIDVDLHYRRNLNL